MDTELKGCCTSIRRHIRTQIYPINVAKMSCIWYKSFIAINTKRQTSTWRCPSPSLIRVGQSFSSVGISQYVASGRSTGSIVSDQRPVSLFVGWLIGWPATWLSDCIGLRRSSASDFGPKSFEFERRRRMEQRCRARENGWNSRSAGRLSFWRTVAK